MARKMYYTSEPKKAEKLSFTIKAAKPRHVECACKAASYSKLDKAEKKLRTAEKKMMKEYCWK